VVPARRIAHIAAAASAALGSCQGDGYEVVVSFDPPDAAAEVDRVEVAFLESCASAPTPDEETFPAVLRFEVQRGGAAIAPGVLPEGRYGLFGRAQNACGLRAQGCRDVDVTADDGAALHLSLEVGSPTSCAFGMACAPTGCECRPGYLECDGVADNGCERLGDACATESVDCATAFDCVIECEYEPTCRSGCAGRVCMASFAPYFNLNECSGRDCSSTCREPFRREDCLACIEVECQGRLAECLDASCS
jgi:hypothetical protein